MAETLFVNIVLGCVNQGVIADVLRYCNNGVHPDHPRHDEFVVPDDRIEPVAAAVSNGERYQFLFNAPGDDQTCLFDYTLLAPPDGTEELPLPHLSFRVYDSYFRTDGETSPEEVRASTAALRCFMRELYSHITESHQPRYLFAMDWPTYDQIASRPFLTEDAIQSGRITNWFWYQILNPAVVERIGRDRLMSAPVWKATRLEDGSVCICVDELPLLPQPGLKNTNFDDLIEYFESNNEMK